MTPPPYSSFEFEAENDSLAFVDGTGGDDSVDEDQRITNLENEFALFIQACSSRMMILEKGLDCLLQVASVQQPKISESTISLSTDDNSESSSCAVFGIHTSPKKDLHTAPVSFDIQFVNVEKKWYTKRPFPDFEIHVTTTNNTNTSTPTDIQIRLFCGAGIFADHLLNTASPLTFPLTNGKCVVSGLRFLAVSSRNGGFFQFEASLCSPTTTTNTVPPVRSPEIRVLSERLKNEPKADDISELRGSDSLVRVPGIGKKYAARFRQLGLKSIRDLATVSDANHMGKRRRELLEAVRKDRGALTEAKLNDLINDAQSVIDRELQDTNGIGNRSHNNNTTYNHAESYCKVGTEDENEDNTKSNSSDSDDGEYVQHTGKRQHQPTHSNNTTRGDARAIKRTRSRDSLAGVVCEQLVSEIVPEFSVDALLNLPAGTHNATAHTNWT
eukprot:c1445_g1_i1.p1 GENE.c1445_g1_i1~~c1445_g1_i1.p1  ORF type:complete len:442 (+),score=124.87 c1445_g1_i1:72-1397(+)